MAWKTADRSYPPDVDPSELIHRITFLNQTVANDASGASANWAPASPPVTTYAGIEEPKGQMVVQAGQDVSQIDCIVKIRYRSGITAQQRFQDAEGNVYLILAVRKPKGMNVWMFLQCQILGNNT
jgi:SPP1 family predicted phage head-tail adaptor